MTTDSSSPDIRRRHFVAVATSSYDDDTWAPLKGVADEVATLQGWLCAHELGGRRFTPTHTRLTENPTGEQIRAALQDPPRPWRSADAAVVFVTGHGQKGHSSHWIVLKGTDSSRLKATGLRTSDVVGWLTDTGIEHLLLVLDLCYAGEIISEIADFDEDVPATWLVLPGAAKNDEAGVGALTTAIADVLRELAEPTGQRFGLDPYLDAGDFVDEVETKLGQRLIPVPGSQRTGPHACLPNPHYRSPDTVPADARRSDLALPKTDLLAHWGPRSRGTMDEAEPGWLFTGRANLIRRLIAATTGPAGTVLVTGTAGSGKSAALARLVTLADPAFLAEYSEQVAAIPSDLRPAERAVDVAVLATGKTGADIVAQICVAVDAPHPTAAGPTPTLKEWLTNWERWADRRRKDRQDPITVVVDGLDEAAQPGLVLSEALVPLAEKAGGQLRLLIGVRSPGGAHGPEGQTGAGVGPGDSLAGLAERLLKATRLRVDERPWWRPGDLADYVQEILAQTPDSPYSTAPAAAVRAVAETLETSVGTSFLVARIAAAVLATDDKVVAADDPAWLREIGSGLTGVFRADLHRSLPDPSDRYRAVQLLRAVAFAYGQGLPWRRIWPAVAGAVDPEHDYGDSDIAWLLHSRLGAYLITDREDGVTVYRLFHDALRTTLRQNWQELLTEPSP